MGRLKENMKIVVFLFVYMCLLFSLFHIINTDHLDPCTINGVCEVSRGENCENCESDCYPAFQYNCCGDGVCSRKFGEDAMNCAKDCIIIETFCGDGNCDLDEDVMNCPADCNCENGFCDENEDCWSCPQDCGNCELGLNTPY